MENNSYHNEGFGWAFLTIVFFMLVFPAMLLFTSLGTWETFITMHLPDGDCWENSRHERVCNVPTEGAKLANCKFGRNFCE